MVKDLLVNNGHRATVESVPNAELEATIDNREKGQLDEIKKSMSDQVGWVVMVADTLLGGLPPIMGFYFLECSFYVI